MGWIISLLTYISLHWLSNFFSSPANIKVEVPTRGTTSFLQFLYVRATAQTWKFGSNSIMVALKNRLRIKVVYHLPEAFFLVTTLWSVICVEQLILSSRRLWRVVFKNIDFSISISIYWNIDLDLDIDYGFW